MAIIKKIASEDYVNQYAQPKGNYLTEHQNLSNYAKKHFIVTLNVDENKNFTVDKTYSEIVSAVEEGKLVILTLDGTYLYMDSVDEEKVRFSYYVTNKILYFDILQNGTIKCSEDELIIGNMEVGCVKTNEKSLVGAINELHDIAETNKNDVSMLKNYVTPQMFGAKGNGYSNDTQAINDALNASSFVYIPDGIYLIDAVSGGIKPKSNQRIILSNNAVLKAITNASKTYNIVNITSVSNVHISGGKIEGENDTHDTSSGGDAGYGILIKSSSHILVENMEISSCWGDCIFMGYTSAKDDAGEYYGIQNEDINIYNCTLHGGRRQGISVVSGLGVIIRDCEIYDITEKSPKAGIDIEPDWVGFAEDVIIDGCYIHDTSGASVIVSGEAKTKIVKISNCNLDAVNCVYGEKITIDNCKIRSITLRKITGYALVMNCHLNKVTTCGGSGMFTNCSFENNEETVVVNCTLDNFSSDQSVITERLSFNHCKFKTNSTATKFMNLVTTTTYSFHQEKVIEFSYCNIDLSAGTEFTHRLPGKELRIDNCDIIFKSGEDYGFVINNNEASRLIVHNSRISCDATLKALIQDGDANTSHYIEHVNNEISAFTNFMKCDNGSTGVLRLINNNMSNENISGTHTFNIFTTSSYLTQHQSLSGYAKTADHYTKTESDNKYQAKGNYLTSVPSEYITETELNAKGYLTQHQSLSGYAKTADHYTKTESDNKYQPKGNYLTSHQDISGKADKSSAETWTFTLADGSTVNKKVVLA